VINTQTVAQVATIEKCKDSISNIMIEENNTLENKVNTNKKLVFIQQGVRELDTRVPEYSHSDLLVNIIHLEQ
jgi:hypothetical protein